MKIVAISDVHNKISKLNIPECDVLVIAGDLTGRGTITEVSKFNNDLVDIKLKAKKIVAIAGNHDFLFEKDPALAKSLIPNVDHYLHDELVEIDGVKFYGSPYQPWFHNWAFNLQRGAELKAKWDLIPDGIDVLITHGPPHKILDRVNNWHAERVGCEQLLEAVFRVKPKHHIFGHIHEDYGSININGINFINASSCDEYYSASNAPVEIEI